MKIRKIQNILALVIAALSLSSFMSYASADLGKTNARSEKRQKKEKGDLKIYIETEINSSADHVWEILGTKYADVSVWSSLVDTSYSITAEDLPMGYEALPNSPVPARITVAGKKEHKITEVLTIYNDESRELKFYGEGLPGFFVSSSDHQRVESIADNKCKVSFNIELKLKGPGIMLKGLLKKRFFKVMTEFQNELKVYAESGEV